MKESQIGYLMFTPTEGGRTERPEFDMGEDEQKALTPHQLSVSFDYGIGQTMMRSGLHLKGV